MYDRQYGGRTLTFEASGGLINSSLVMQDRETDTYWPIMKGEGVEGELKGTRLKELAVNRKMKWKKWRRKHPDTLVLTVNGREDETDVYRDYFRSRQGFRGSRAKDKRLKTKESVFVFRLDDQDYAARHKNIKGGKSFEISGKYIFLFRAAKAGLHDSTLAMVTDSGKLVRGDAGWQQADGSCQFSELQEKFIGSDDCPQDLVGFDTFWYNWSLNNPDTKLL